MRLHVSVPLSPVAAGRPRFGRDPRTGMTRTYMPQKTANAVQTLGMALAAARPKGHREPTDRPVHVMATVYRKLPSRVPQRDWETARPIGRPDLDNYLVLLMNAGTGVLWKDDSQVVMVRVEKRYAIPPTEPRWDIAVVSV